MASRRMSPVGAARRRSYRRLLLLASAVVLIAMHGTAMPGAKPDAAALEAAFRKNNVGVAWMEQFNYGKAAASFEEALRLAPNLGIARFNLALSLFYDGKIEEASTEARLAAERLPGAPQPLYLRGLIARADNRGAEAVAAFSQVLHADPGDAGANIGLGQARLQTGDFAGAAAAFAAALAAEPFNATAAYNLSVSLSRAGRTGASGRALARFQALRQSGTATTFGNTYLEQGRLAEALVSTGLEPDLVRDGTPDVRFSEMRPPTAPAAPAGEGGLAALDADGDGVLDLADVSAARCRVWVNDGRGGFSESSAGWKATAGPGAIGVVAADVTGDGKPDLLVVRRTAVSLYRNEGGLRFADITREAGLAGPVTAGAAALVDVDHDGDLDILLAGGHAASAAARTRLWRNDGTGSFTDVTTASALAGTHVVGVVPTDFDERRDVDLLLVPSDAALTLFRNTRDGSFENAARAAGLPAGTAWSTVAAADLNKDGRTDFFFGRPNGPGVLALSTGRLQYRNEPAPDGTAGARAAVILDYDNDGLLDLVVFGTKGGHILRNEAARWRDVTAAAAPAGADPGLPAIGAGRALVAADVDGDGDTDLVFRAAGAPRLWRNEGGSRAPSLSVPLTGHVSNRSGVGAKVEVRAGSLRDRRETSATMPAVAPADVLFGLGAGRRADAVRVLWPSGILQAEILRSPVARLPLTEVDRKPSSCPFLFTWNGSRFEFITDFLGGGEMGYWAAPGTRNVPDPDEYVRIPGSALRPRNGRLELRITNELEETLFFDSARLHVIDHPAGVEIHPLEGLVSRRRLGLQLMAVSGSRPPARATDERGDDVLSLVACQDWHAPAFPLARIRGYAAPHYLEIAAAPDARADVLLLTGWTDYAYSSDNVAASHARLALEPPVLQVQRSDGAWAPAGVEVGVPAGRPQTLVVDLRPVGGADGRRFRVVTNMRIYWDQARFGRVASMPVTTPAVLAPLAATLADRGFSREIPTGPGRLSLYDYQRVSRASPWKQMIGRYTAEGPVLGLLTGIDDRFVIAGPGDEVALSFDAAAAGTPPPGWERTYLLQADGFSKEMDLHSVSPDAVGPLPFRAMRQYPPAPGEATPHDAAEGPASSRSVVRAIPRLESLLVPD